MNKRVLIFLLLLVNNLIYIEANSDSLFIDAISKAKAKNYTQSEININAILKNDSQRQDVVLYLASLYAWQNKYDSALMVIDNLYHLNPENHDLYDVWLNVLLWSKRYDELLKIIHIARENNYNDAYNLGLKELIVYKEQGEYNKGIKFVNASDKSFLDSTLYKAIYNEISALNKQNYLSFYYTQDFFDDSKLLPQHLVYIDYGFKIKKNTLLFRLNYANKFKLEDLQMEADYYQIFKNNKYLYLNYGLGFQKNLFPAHRFGVEYFSSHPKFIDYSIGGRYLDFTSTQVYILTGHLGKYYKNSWFALRPYFSFLQNTNSLVLLFNYRLYGKNPINYWGIEVGYGNSPDDRYVTSLQNAAVFRLEAYKIRIEKNFFISNKHEIKLSSGIAREEAFLSTFRNRYIIEALYKYKF
jgi:YaiO family outer membrane protein